MKEKTGNKKRLKLLFAAAFIMILAMGTIALTGCGDGSGGGGSGQTPAEPEVVINPITGLEVDGELIARPVQVSIPNDTYGAIPQSNISYADIIYEFPVEGDITRLQAIYYSDIPDKFGPIRSVRYYFVDLATEYQACHIGYGWGKHARDQMFSNNIFHVNGMDEPEYFYRVSDKTAPNNAYIDWSSIEKVAADEGWFDEPVKLKGWKFRDDEWVAAQQQAKADAQAIVDELGESTAEEDVAKVEEAKKVLEAEPEKATDIYVKSAGCNSSCKYDPETGKYARFWYGEKYIDKETGEQLTFDNILVQMVHSDIMVDDQTGLDDNKGRLTIDMFAGGEGYLFTQGEVIQGTWERDTVNSRTIFKDNNGRQFRFTPGKTWVYVLDQTKQFSYEDNTPDEETETE